MTDPRDLAADPEIVAEALERLAGRRALAIELSVRGTVVVENKGQNRKTRRNNLRLARVAVREQRKLDTANAGVIVQHTENGTVTLNGIERAPA